MTAEHPACRGEHPWHHRFPLGVSRLQPENIVHGAGAHGRAAWPSQDLEGTELISKQAEALEQLATRPGGDSMGGPCTLHATRGAAVQRPHIVPNTGWCRSCSVWPR